MDLLVLEIALTNIIKIDYILITRYLASLASDLLERLVVEIPIDKV